MRIGDKLDMDLFVSVGFGIAQVNYNGCPMLDDEETVKRLRDFEALAVTLPPGSWSVVLEAPTWGLQAHREGPNDWRVTAMSEGFA